MSGRIAIVVFALLVGCRKQEPAASETVQPSAAGTQPLAADVDRQAPRRALPPGTVEPPSLPEDPEAGQRATTQWREHLDREEEERQMFFDRPRLAQHRAIARSLKLIRAGYDRAKTERAVEQARQTAAHKLDDVAQRVKELDPWGNNSRLLPDYVALQAAFANEYADAKLAAVRGDATAFAQTRADVEARFRSVEKWLEEAAGEDDEEAREREPQR